MNTAPRTIADDERADDPRAAPTPLLALDNPKDERRDRQREQDRAGKVGHPPAPGSAALDETAAGEHDGCRADRQVDEKHEPPVAGGDEQPAERRAQPGGGGRDRRQQRDTVRAPVKRERAQHQPQRCGNQKRRAEGLHHPEDDQDVRRRRDRAQQRGDREQLEAEHEDPPAPKEIGDPPRGHQKRCEDDVVRIQHPGQRRDRRPGERPLDVGERDIDDRRVDERDRGPQRGDREHRPRRRSAPTRQRRRDRDRAGAPLRSGRWLDRDAGA